MIIVADSGSMKCDWAVVSRDGRVVKEFKTMGFHPLFDSSTLIEKILGHMSEFKTIASQIEEVYFYGPGNEIPQRARIIEMAMRNIFNNAETVEVNDD
ncbi:MAG TPA: N-acetylglucosamine kinase, partial [Bacteroidetes bacterium]|nr:N-acetylglucosamine kinase [Bacteroidota bacterium]